MLTEPLQKEVFDGQTIDLGTIGPGQTLSLGFEPQVTEGGKFNAGGRYDFAKVASVPVGWKSEDAKQYGNPLQVKITADPRAKEGTYEFEMEISDEKYSEELRTIRIKGKVRITYDVIDVEIGPNYQKTIPGEAARYSVTINNKANTADTFEVEGQGEKRLSFKKVIYVPARSSRTIVYELAGDEEEIYTVPIRVLSQSSDIIQSQKTVQLQVSSDVIGDYKATTKGIFLFPIFELPIHAFAGLISNLWN